MTLVTKWDCRIHHHQLRGICPGAQSGATNGGQGHLSLFLFSKIGYTVGETLKLKPSQSRGNLSSMRKIDSLGKPTPQQITAWRTMSPARRLELAFQAYQFALDAVRLTERKRHPDLSTSELAWRITRRMQGNSKLGR